MNASSVLQILNITRPTLSKYVNDGTIKAIKKENGQYDYDSESVYKLLNKNNDTNIVKWSPNTCLKDGAPTGTLICGGINSKIAKRNFLVNIVNNSLNNNENPIIIDFGNRLFDYHAKYSNYNIIDLDKLSTGSLNPFILIPNLYADELTNIIECLCGAFEASIKNNLHNHIIDYMTIKHNNLDLYQLGYFLLDIADSDIQQIGTLLLVSLDYEYGNLISANNTDKVNDYSSNVHLDFNDTLYKKPIIIHTKHTMPDYDFATHFISNRVLQTITYIILLKIYKENHDNLNNCINTLFINGADFLFNESYAISDLIFNMLLTGKTSNKCMVLDINNIANIPTTFASVFSSKFIFRLSSVEQINYYKNLYNISNIDVDMTNLFNNTCLFEYLNESKLIKIY